jgi:branched-chain amino acid transport system substrate-binding protein
MLEAAIEKAKSCDGKAIAAAMKNACGKVKDHLRVLLDVCLDDEGGIDRESFLVEVKNGKQEVTAMLPMLNKR